MQYATAPRFPGGFLWGASTSAYQVEGGWDADGRGPSVVDVRTNLPEGTSDFSVASDHYHRFREDVALLAELGLKAYRFSVSWSRVLPEGTGRVNRAGLAFYRELVDALVDAGIEPVLTLYHFDLPAALERQGGWSNRATIDAFEEYTRLLVAELGDKVRYWLTINEQNVMILFGGAVGVEAPDGVDRGRWAYQQNHHMLVAQARAIRAVHELAPGAWVAPAPNIACVYPASSDPRDIVAADDFAAVRNWLYLDAVAQGRYNSLAWAYLGERGWRPRMADTDLDELAAARPDFLAFNYYTSHTVAAARAGEDYLGGGSDQHLLVGEEGLYRGTSNPHLATGQFGWEVDPVGFRTTFRQIWERYHLPLLVTENGIGAYDVLEPDGSVHDPYRIEYLDAHVEQMRLAVGDGVEVMGYCPWSAIDLVSTHQGVRKRYGFVYVDRTDDDVRRLARRRKDSFFWYQSLIAKNGG